MLDWTHIGNHSFLLLIEHTRARLVKEVTQTSLQAERDGIFKIIKTKHVSTLHYVVGKRI